MNIKKLQKPVCSLEILVHLHRNEKATITQLIKQGELNQRTTYSALGKLLDQELICHEESNGFPVCKYYELTDKGKPVAKHLNAVDKLLVQTK
ncbi:MAG: winged helix-turn-helix transcriptional regulator [Thermoplasmata archaeon]|nr:winged helix-turn-helix transcriptional regulator [Thermoplasmata archaeon]